MMPLNSTQKAEAAAANTRDGFRFILTMTRPVQENRTNEYIFETRVFYKPSS